MRTIKFRGKRKLNGEWVYGSLISIGDDWCQIVPEGTDYDTLKEDLPIIRVITDTIGQFTGLLDVNGVEIWEGDKIHRHLGVEWIVTFHESRWVALPKSESGLYLGPEQFVESEVTGNIHDK